MLELLFDNQVVDTRPLTLPPGETSPQVFTATQERDGIFTVRIDAKDDLAADNQASIVSLLPAAGQGAAGLARQSVSWKKPCAPPPMSI